MSLSLAENPQSTDKCGELEFEMQRTRLDEHRWRADIGHRCSQKVVRSLHRASDCPAVCSWLDSDAHPSSLEVGHLGKDWTQVLHLYRLRCNMYKICRADGTTYVAEKRIEMEKCVQFFARWQQTRSPGQLIFVEYCFFLKEESKLAIVSKWGAASLRGSWTIFNLTICCQDFNHGKALETINSSILLEAVATILLIFLFEKTSEWKDARNKTENEILASIIDARIIYIK